MQDPSVDLQNPLYCPSVSAASYLKSLRPQLARRRSHAHSESRRRRDFPHLNETHIVSFAQILCEALLTSIAEDECANYGSPKDLRALLPSVDKASRVQDPSPIPSTPIDDTFAFSNTKSPRLTALGRKRKRAESFSDLLQGAAKYAFKKAALPTNTAPNTSFPSRKIPKIEPLSESPVEKISVEGQLRDRIRILEEHLYGSAVGAETPGGLNQLVDRLASLMPGVRLKERLEALEDHSHQGMADFLGHNGYFTPQVLALLRTSEITSLALSKSLGDQDGLNLASRDLLAVFAQPNSFFFLTELSFNGTPVLDSDLVHIHHLPKLSTLLLNNTSIGNEAIFLLIPLKYTLTQLSIANNSDINNDSVPALILLSKLSFLSILDTSIGMEGLRRLAQVINNEARVVDIEIPEPCEAYIDSLHREYLINPSPPLISSPSLCSHLSAAALKRNLAAHAACNPEIIAGGSKSEMKQRLEGILERREQDLLVRGMLWNLDGAEC
ncbi:hypothetical protein C8J56DRAFT_1115426 [Mycena floridula]|nr:hypothetical protein C8J56DRAFT_1115426 [Mycena floridula]